MRSFIYAAIALSFTVASTQAVTKTGKVHKVMVGMDASGAPALAYHPANITAKVGDIVEFIYMNKNHSVTQSSFADPCTLVANATAKTIGFDSGYVPVAPDAKELQAWQLLVEVDTPIWYYCAQAGHCTQGMVGSINAVEDSPKNFDAYKALALKATQAPPPPPAISTKGASKDTAKAVIHNVLVGMTDAKTPGLGFFPANISANVGDVVNFIYTGKNHTVTQSSFGAPCSLVANQTINAVGFDSGFVPSPPNATDFPTWSFTVENTAPIWYYCAQGNHCSSGMVGSVNAVESGPKNFAAYKATAMATKQDAPPAAPAAPAGGASNNNPAPAGGDQSQQTNTANTGGSNAAAAGQDNTGNTPSDQSQSGAPSAALSVHAPRAFVALSSVVVGYLLL